jgi:hypothetical protein
MFFKKNNNKLFNNFILFATYEKRKKNFHFQLRIFLAIKEGIIIDFIKVSS